MIGLTSNRLVFRFEDVHAEASASISFQRTLRVPESEGPNALPAGLGDFPLELVDDHREELPGSWVRRGGVMAPMHDREALWMDFSGDYPVALKIAAGKINAISGERWRDGLHRDPQDYAVLPEQPWVDGFKTGEGVVRQFVAAPLGEGATVEEQLSGKAEFGGIQLQCFPMKAEVYERWKAEQDRLARSVRCFAAPPTTCRLADVGMGLGAGGRIRQEIHPDPHDFDVWDTRHGSRVFVHLLHARSWEGVTGQPCPTEPPTPGQYRKAGIPWFETPQTGQALPGSGELAGVTTVGEHDGQGRDRAPVVSGEPVVRLPARQRHAPGGAISDGDW